MSDLTAFLLARLDEDEATWSLDFSTPDDVPVTLTVGDAATSIVTPSGFASRMRADVQAKRALLDLHAEAPDGDCGTCFDYYVVSKWDGLCDVRQILAAVYADHADYREEWRP